MYQVGNFVEMKKNTLVQSNLQAKKANRWEIINRLGA